MARIFTCGFEGGTYDLTKLSSYSGASVISSAGLSMDGNYCLECSGIYDYAQKAITADSEMYFAFLYRTTSISSTPGGIVSFYSGSTLLGFLRSAAATGVISAYSGTSTLLSTSSTAISANVTYLIEVYYKIDDAAGRFSVKVNGIQTGIDFTGDTKPGTASTFDMFRLAYNNDPSTTILGYCYYDNIVLDDAAWIGKTYIQGLAVTGVGATSNFTTSTGSGDNYTFVDEIPADTTNYVWSNTNNHVDTYVMGNLAGTIGTIRSLSVNAYAEKQGAATPQNLQLVTRPVATDRVSASVAIPTTFAVLQGLWEQDPDTSSAWIEAGINGSEIGGKVVA